MHSARLRIFTPSTELPFAGHPTVGTAVLLAMRKVADGAPGNEMMVLLEEAVGSIRCGVFIKGERLGHAIFDAPALPMPVPAEFDRDAVAAAVGLLPAEIGFENHKPTGMVGGRALRLRAGERSRRRSATARPNVTVVGRGASARRGPSAWLYCRDTESGDHDFHARMFAPGFGIAEDPATGSAAAAFAGVVRQLRRRRARAPIAMSSSRASRWAGRA